jgi:hypothetical protein
VHLLTVKLEPRVSTMDEVELLVRVLLHVIGSQMTWLACQLVVLVDDPVARLAGRPGVDAEGRDAEVVPYRPPGAAAVADLVDVVKLRHCVTAHGTSQGRGRPELGSPRLTRSRQEMAPWRGT